jgi:primosomal protein N' (replication factor Y)
MKILAEVAIPVALRQTFTYAIPPSLSNRAYVGQRVYVPFGKAMQIGMIVSIRNEDAAESIAAQGVDNISLRYIQGLLDDEAIIDEDLLQLIMWISTYYASSPGMCIQSALPSGMNFQSVTHLQIAKEANPFGLGRQIQHIFDAISKTALAPRTEIEKRFKATRLIDKMIKDGLIQEILKPVLSIEYPTEAWIKTNTASEVQLWLEEHANDEKKKWVQFVYAFIEQSKTEGIRLTEVQKWENYSLYCLNRAIESGVLIKEERTALPGLLTAKNIDFRANLSELNPAQEEAFQTIEPFIKSDKKPSSYHCFLLKGITGSGKTEVYIHAIAKALLNGQNALILVPEIALTPQTLARFINVFGDVVVSLHSKQSPKERLSSWAAIKKGRYRIVLGPRSAVFAPIPNLGVIVVDEEHDSSYRQHDPEPRYHARDVAIMRANMLKIPVILGSATPNLVSMQRAVEGKFTLLNLAHRYGEAQLPNVQILDMKAYRFAMKGPFTAALYQAIEKRLERKEQVILLLNRRGYGAYIQSAASGEIAECPNCSISLTYHHHDKSARCHYCGYSEAFWRIANRFGQDDTLIQGFGTQAIEETISKLFPSARVLRMDHDTTSKKDGHEQILTAFGNRKADILVGTQMVAKGLDFPNVTLVGVLMADQELGFPFFNAAERSFQMLSQVSGRSGRAEKAGQVLIQSWQPEHPVYAFVKTHNYESFFKHEISQRKALNYPPFSKLMAWRLKGLDSQMTADAATILTEVLQAVWKKAGFDGSLVLGPAPALVLKQYNRFCWDVMIKLPEELGTNRISKLIMVVDQTFKKRFQDTAKNDLRVLLDIDIK